MQMHPWDGSGSLAGPTHRGPALHCTDYIADAPPLRGWGLGKTILELPAVPNVLKADQIQEVLSSY